MKLEDFVGKELPERDWKKVIEADAFYEVAKYAEKQLPSKENFEVKEGIYVIPAIVNMAFACELYLKSFFMGKKEGHYLDKLMEELPDVIKRFVKFECISNGIASSEDDFNTKLSNISNAFVDWRYFYEDDKSGMQIDYLFLNSFAYSLRLLKVLYENND